MSNSSGPVPRYIPEDRPWVQPPATQPTIVSDEMASEARKEILQTTRSNNAKMNRLRNHQRLEVQRIVQVLTRLPASPADFAVIYDALAAANVL
jgi:hypothetical protein